MILEDLTIWKIAVPVVMAIGTAIYGYGELNKEVSTNTENIKYIKKKTDEMSSTVNSNHTILKMLLEDKK